MQGDMPVFIKVEDYKDVLEIINSVKEKVEQAKSTLDIINKMKKEEDAELELWHHTIDEVENKLDFIDRTLFEPANL